MKQSNLRLYFKLNKQILSLFHYKISCSGAELTRWSFVDQNKFRFAMMSYALHRPQVKRSLLIKILQTLTR